MVFAALRLVNRRRHPDWSDPDNDLTRTARDGTLLTITGVDGDTVLCSRYDPETGKTDAWAGSWSSFEALTR